MTGPDTVPASELGIGDDEVESKLNEHAEAIASVDHAVVDAEVKNDVLAGVAHIHVTLSATLTTIPKEIHNYIVAKGLVILDPNRNDDGTLTFRLTTTEIYGVWGEMDAPDLQN